MTRKAKPPKEGMKQIKVTVTLGLVGCKREEIIEVEADLSEEEISEIAEETLFSMIEWGWTGVEK